MSAMVDVKVAELSGSALDWAVAKAQGVEIDLPGSDVVWAKYAGAYSPSTDWSQGGPLIESQMVSLHCPQSTYDIWAGWVIADKGEFCQGGDTALIAVCRTIVAAKLGDVVNVPEELIP